MHIKVGYITAANISLLLPKGDAIHIRSFLENFIKIGGEIFFIRKNMINEEINNIKIYNIKWIKRKLKGLNDFLFNLRLYQAGSSIIRKEKPDIIHEREIFFNLAGLLLARKFKIPYVLEINAPLMYEVGRYYSHIYQEIGREIENKLFAGADKIIVVSNILKNYLVNYGVIEEKIRVVPNGVDENIFHPSTSGENVRRKYHLEDKEVICFAGSLHQQWQGIDDLLKSAKIISSIKPSVRFLIIGNTEGQEEILKTAPDNVVFTGEIPHSEVPTYLAAADILVAPYKLEEVFKDIGFYNSPVKLFEYMAMGKPIIASNIGQIGEILEHGKTGLLIEPGNYKELTEYILTLLEDEQLKRKLGKNARSEVEKKYTWEHNARRIMEIYNEVLGEQ